MNRKIAPVPTPFVQRASTRERLKEILDFGPDAPYPAQGMSNRVNERIRELVRKLAELNQRIDKLNSRS